VRVWAISVTDDQQLAGVIMKLGGSVFLWTLITIFFFRWWSRSQDLDHSYRRTPPPATAATPTATTAPEAQQDDAPLTWADVEAELERVPPVPDPRDPH
jgi:hypothetical protein